MQRKVYELFLTTVVKVGVYLVLEGPPIDGGAAPASTRGISALDHEILDDPMKLDSVVVASPGQL